VPFFLFYFSLKNATGHVCHLGIKTYGNVQNGAKRCLACVCAVFADIKEDVENARTGFEVRRSA